MIEQVTSATTGSTTTSTSGSNSIDPQEFLKIMLKEMQSQDPFQPMSSEALVNQMAQVRNIQSSMELSSTLKDLAMAQKLNSAGGLLGKVVTGKNSSGADISGTVTSVRKEGDTVYLELDTGEQMSLDNVLSVNNPTATSDSATGSGTSANANTNTTQTK